MRRPLGGRKHSRRRLLEASRRRTQNPGSSPQGAMVPWTLVACCLLAASPVGRAQRPSQLALPVNGAAPPPVPPAEAPAAPAPPAPAPQPEPAAQPPPPETQLLSPEAASPAPPAPTPPASEPTPPAAPAPTAQAAPQSSPAPPAAAPPAPAPQPPAPAAQRQADQQCILLPNANAEGEVVGGRQGLASVADCCTACKEAGACSVFVFCPRDGGW